MKSYSRLFFLFTVFLFFSFNVHADAAKTIQQLHEQYLTTDFKNEESLRKLFTGIRDGFMEIQSSKPEDTAMLENLIGLYNKVLSEAQKVRYPKDLIEHAKGKRNLELLFPLLKEYE